jgi:hypothetical protein
MMIENKVFGLELEEDKTRETSSSSISPPPKRKKQRSKNWWLLRYSCYRESGCVRVFIEWFSTDDFNIPKRVNGTDSYSQQVCFIKCSCSE